jgi:hypothetical protein
MGQGDALRSDCQEQSAGEFCWEPDILECDYLLSTRIFELLATEGESTISLWLPKLDHEQRLDSFVKILNENSERLGGLEVKKSSWPQVPATRVELTRTDETSLLSSKTQSKHENEASIRSSMQNTEQWVEDVLCGLSLCPYTKSMERAAVGLESVGIEEGPIEIRHSLDIDNDLKGISPPPAVVLATAFWQGVKELAQKSEKDVATLLIIAPPYFDDEFFEFSATFNKFLEPTIQATGAESIVGRAIFHPTYNSELIGHDTVLPGHALPVNMVGGFMDQYLVEENSYATKEKPDLSSIAKANDAVRWTPHATINLLRRSQVSKFIIPERSFCHRTF